MGTWVYGCDACQDACPYNRQKWEAAEEYPGLNELSEMLGLDQIIAMDYDTLLRVIQPKFWYIGKDRVWKWRVNALNAMRNTYKPDFETAIRTACTDENEHVRKTAQWVLGPVGLR